LDPNPWQNTTNIRRKHEFSIAIIYDLVVLGFSGGKDLVCGATWGHAMWYMANRNAGEIAASIFGVEVTPFGS
jgi:hypothetical protein